MVILSLLPSSLMAHGGGLVNLTACTVYGGDKGQFQVHLDAFQAGDGPFCYDLPATGRTRIVLDLREKLQKQPLRVKLVKVKADPREEQAGSNPQRILTSIPKKTHRSGVVSFAYSFRKAGKYQLRVLVEGTDEPIIFPLYVGVTPPLTLLTQTAVLSVLERPYALMFSLMVIAGLIAFYYGRKNNQLFIF